MSHPTPYTSIESIKGIERQRYHHFFNLALFLAVLTGFEIIAIFLPFSRHTLLTLLIECSVIKFIGVVLWFMHIIYDRMILLWVFLSGLIIACGTVYALMKLFSPVDVDHALYAEEQATSSF